MQWYNNFCLIGCISSDFVPFSQTFTARVVTSFITADNTNILEQPAVRGHFIKGRIFYAAVRRNFICICLTTLAYKIDDISNNKIFTEGMTAKQHRSLRLCLFVMVTTSLQWRLCPFHLKLISWDISYNRKLRSCEMWRRVFWYSSTEALWRSFTFSSILWKGK